MSYIGNEPIVSATRTITEVTATAGQTVFVANGGYTVGYIDVFLNGAQLQTVDFTATNGSSITLTEAAQVGDVLKLVAWGTFSTSNLVSPNYTGTLTGGTDVVNIGSGQLYKDASGNVGIGTSSPSDKLTVVSTGSSLARFTRDLATDVSLSIGADNDGVILEASGVNTLRLFTNAAERFRIDSAGRVTMPYQPAFTVTGGTNVSGTVNPVIMTNVILNRGSHYNTSNGRFTAPVNGVYFFSGSVDPTSSGNVSTMFYKNGSFIADLRSYAAAGDGSQSVSGLVSLNAGDYVTLATNSGFEGSLSHFTGFLLG